MSYEKARYRLGGLGRIMNTSSDVEKELALIVVKGFERLFKVL